MVFRRDISAVNPTETSPYVKPIQGKYTNGDTNGGINGSTNGNTNGVTNGSTPDAEHLDMVIVGAGFAGCYLLHQLRKKGFSAKIIEAGSDLGGIWYWNRYPGARVDSQYPVYALSIPEVYRTWTWKSHYPDHTELREYFQHLEKCIHVKKDCVFNSKVTEARWDDTTRLWTITCDTGKSFKTRFWTACTGFAAKRYFPAWEGIEEYKGVIHHSSFWPEEHVNVEGKKVGVIGTGSTGIQITQEWCREIGDKGELKMFQRTPNLCCPLNQAYLTKEEQEKVVEELGGRFAERNKYFNGFLYQWRDTLTFNDDADRRHEFYEMLWRMGGFRFLMNNYYDMTREPKANREAYEFWRDHVRQRVKDPRKQELLAPWEPPHLFGGKRLALEQDFYDHFDKPNVDVVDLRNNPIVRFTPDGVVQADGTHHQLDIIALATGFDAITGGIKDIKIIGIDGEVLTDKWAKGTWTYLGMATARFPNLFFTYGPQAPTAFANGPTCIELQGNWITQLLVDMREQGLTKIDTTKSSEESWKARVHEWIVDTPRGKVDSWYNGSNIPGKPIEHLNYAGGLPLYKKTIDGLRETGYRENELSGFVMS